MNAKSPNLYIIILEIESMEVGHHYSAGLHTTVIYWFLSSRSYKDIAKNIAVVAKDHPPFEIEALEREDFGAKESLEVYLVKKTKDLTRLHYELLDNLEDVEFENPQYQKEGWRPHVTTQGERSFVTGSKHMVKNIYLIEALNANKDGDKMVRAKVELGTGEITT